MKVELEWNVEVEATAGWVSFEHPYGDDNAVYNMRPDDARTLAGALLLAADEAERMQRKRAERDSGRPPLAARQGV